MPQPSTCHPSRPNHGRGLCKPCYLYAYYHAHKETLGKKRKRRYKACRERELAKQKLYYLSNPEIRLLLGARDNARRMGRECTITKEDIKIPEKCPVLGIPIKRNSDRCAWDSMTLDRIDSNLDYVPGNVAVISYRANLIKNCGTAEEHRKIADWMDIVCKPFETPCKASE